MVLKRPLWLLVVVLILSSCATNRYGPWFTPSGDLVSNSIMLEFKGFKQCGTDKVVFIRFLGKQYAYDPEGQLGTLTGTDGQVLTYAELDSPPAGAEPTGVQHEDEEIWRVPSDVDNYLYVVFNGTLTQRWPRAEVGCQQ